MPDTQDTTDLPLGPNDLRDRIPVLGLPEFWYPALKDQAVGWKKPVFLRMLSEDLCFFRGKSSQVVAFDNACPHRGAMLAHGNCEFRGYLSCFYHGFVFDERGECVAALGEGPASPMPGKIRARVYPTETHKGIVFVWMGKGKPVPIQDHIPEEFFQSDDTMVLAWNTVWKANWRPCFENSFDSHVRYLHRNSFMLLIKPMYPPAYPPGRPRRVGAHRLTPSMAVHKGTDAVQEYYPGLDAHWPQRRLRKSWAWLFKLLKKPFDRLPRYHASEDWEMGQHLPCMVRINYHTYMWTRWAVPIDAQTTRMFYVHTAVRHTALGRAFEWVSYHLFHHWVMDRNFSAQDAPAAINAYYDRPEYLAPTDAQLVGWRRFLLSALGREKRE